MAATGSADVAAGSVMRGSVWVSCDGDDRTDVLAVERTADQSGQQAVADLDLAHVPGVSHQLEHRALDDPVGMPSSAAGA